MGSTHMLTDTERQLVQTIKQSQKEAATFYKRAQRAFEKLPKYMKKYKKATN